jgi:homoserine dehydrogenase
VALAGCGTVGSGVSEIVIHRAATLAERTGLRFDIVRALVADPSRKRDVALPASVFTANPEDLQTAQADLLVEVIGGTDTARKVVLAALRAGTPVVTANKALLAKHGAEIYQAARAAGTCVAFEASCAGGLPIVGTLLRGLQANRVERVIGILNSTCNFILTQMLNEGMPFDVAVAAAQKLGYAEANPTLDISGGDTAHKLTILASLAFGLNLDLERVRLGGIENVQLTDLVIAEELGYAVKLLGIATRASRQDGTNGTGEHVSLRVHPTLVPRNNPVGAMDGTSSGISVDGDVVGNTFYAGEGAGSLPTASAVVADMIDVATGAAERTFTQLRVFNDQTPPALYVDPDEEEDAYYVRLNTDSPLTSPAAIKRTWRQTPVDTQLIHHIESHGAVVAITKPISEEKMRAAVHHLVTSLKLTAQPAVLRVLTD